MTAPVAPIASFPANGKLRASGALSQQQEKACTVADVWSPPEMRLVPVR
ncbi:MAG TPA: hypothetical protein VF953_11160 [Terriglobales bacterium]